MPENKSIMSERIRKELKELTASISVMMDTFRQLKQPIQESSVQLPNTASQLEQVTEQTEQATHRVLDMVEAISNRENTVAKEVARIRELIPSEMMESNTELSTLIQSITDYIEANISDSYSIMDALQFQDITTQQIDHAISLLDDVESKLRAMQKAVGIKQTGEERAPKRKKAFDPNAHYSSEKPTQQQEIDQIISGIK